MKIPRRLVIVPVAIASLIACASVQAAPVTIGSPLTASFSTGEFNSPGTYANLALPEAGTHVTSPVTGMIVRWRITNSSGGPYTLRVLRHVSGSTFEGVGTSTPQTPVSTATQTYETSLPIQAGDAIGLNGEVKGKVGLALGVTGAEYLLWAPPLADGVFAAGVGAPSKEIGFNADVEPQPSVTSIAPVSGPASGGTSVVIAGTELAGASAVTFGSANAAAFTVDSPSKITATSPPSTVPGAVDVTVTTAGGTSPTVAADSFTYTALPTTGSTGHSSCTVPRLQGKKLKAAKKIAKKAGCAVGAVKKLKGATAGTGKVVKQRPKAGKILPAGNKIALTLR